MGNLTVDGTFPSPPTPVITSTPGDFTVGDDLTVDGDLDVEEDVQIDGSMRVGTAAGADSRDGAIAATRITLSGYDWFFNFSRGTGARDADDAAGSLLIRVRGSQYFLNYYS